MSKLTRRRFLGTAAALVGTTALGGYRLISPARAAEIAATATLYPPSLTGLCLPQSAPAGQNPDCGQPRRFRRTRQAQRIHGGRQNADYLRRQRKSGFARRHVFAQSQTAGEGNRHRLQKIRTVFPAGFVPQNVGAETRRVLRQRHVRQGQSGGGAA